MLQANNDIVMNSSMGGDSQMEIDLRDIEQAKAIATVLLKHYPGHIWNVSVDSSRNNRTCDIKLNYPDRLGILPKYGYKIHLSILTDEKVVRAGGELLERHRLARGRSNSYTMADVIKNGCDRSGEIH
jgi:hypothetical protein